MKIKHICHNITRRGLLTLLITLFFLPTCFYLSASGNPDTSYIPGKGSYSLSEGISPYNWFFANHNEKVNTFNGNLYIDRTDINISGRGISLILESQFYSLGYYWNNRNKNSAWDFKCELYGCHTFNYRTLLQGPHCIYEKADSK